MTKEKSHTIRLLNKSHTVKCPETEIANLELAANKLNEQWRIQKKKFIQLDDTQALLMAALHISHELVTCQRQQEEQRHQVTEFINSLESKIHHVVGGYTHPELISSLITKK